MLFSPAWKVVMFLIENRKKLMFISVISFLLDERLAELVILTAGYIFSIYYAYENTHKGEELFKRTS